MTNDKTPTLRPIVTVAIVCLSLCGVAVGAELSSEGTADSLSRATHHALTATVTPGVFARSCLRRLAEILLTLNRMLRCSATNPIATRPTAHRF